MASEKDKLTATTQRAMERAEQTKKMRENELAAGTDNSDTLSKALDASGDLISAQSKQIDSLQTDNKVMRDARKPERLKLAGRTALGDMGAHAINEGFNALVRWQGDKDRNSFTANNSDFLQSIPQAAIGFVWYALEMYKLKGEWPKGFQAVRIEAANLLMNLGMSNLWRVLRTRKDETKEQRVAMQSALRESLQRNADIQGEMDSLRGKFDVMAKRSEESVAKAQRNDEAMSRALRGEPTKGG
jgi:hypothetical protein